MPHGPAPEAPIGVFDSGVGGLTVLHELLVSLPEEDYLYLGDDARFPYGARSLDDLSVCVERNTRFLLERGAKLIVIACNSAASAGLEAARSLAAEHGVEVVAVIEPESEIAAAITDSGRVGVLATLATVEGGAYLRSLAGQHRNLTVTQVAAPDLAAIIQRGFPFSEAVVDTVRTLLRAASPRRRGHRDPGLHPLSAGSPAPAAHPRTGRPSRHGRSRDGRNRRAHPRGARPDDANARGGLLQLRLHGRAGAFRELGTRFLQLPLGEVELVDL